MAKDHHDYSVDKDMAENVQQLITEKPKSNMKSNQGLPADERLNEYQEVEDNIDTDTEKSLIQGLGVTQPLPGEFRKEK